MLPVELVTSQQGIIYYMTHHLVNGLRLGNLFYAVNVSIRQTGIKMTKFITSSYQSKREAV